MISKNILQDIQNLYKNSAPLGGAPSFLDALKENRITLERTDGDNGGYMAPWERFFDEVSNEESEKDLTKGEDFSGVLNFKKKDHVLSRSSYISFVDTLKLLKQVWSNMEQDYLNQSLSSDQEKQLSKIIDFLTSSIFIANKDYVDAFAKEFQSYDGLSILPKELKNAPNPFIEFDNDFLNGMLFSDIKSFLKKYPTSLPYLLNDAFDRNISLFEQMSSLLPVSTIESNIDWFLSNMNINSKQKDAFKIFLNISLLPEDMSFDVFSFFENLPSFKQDEFSDLLDFAFNLPLKTFQSLFKDETGFVHKNGLANHRAGFRPSKPFSSVIKKATLRDFRFYFSEKIDFLRSISTDYLKDVDTTATNVTRQDLNHIGQDVENLLVALKQSTKKNFKILITGRPGSGKTSLVNFALEQSKRLGATVFENDVDSYSIQSLRDFSSILGNSVILIDGCDAVSEDELTSTIKARSSSTEIWTTSDPKVVSDAAMSSFDLVINIPTFPFEKRKELADRLFDDEKLSDKVAKVCSTPGEIVRLHEWSSISGQNSWKELSVIANNIVQASIKSKTDAMGKNLPISLHQPSDTNYGFDQVVGCNSIVNQAKKMIAGYHHPQSFKVVGAKPPKGILLTGGPGLGKTYLVKAMAHEAGVPLLIASSSAMSSEPDLISSVFSEARRQAPCILFLDEIDALGASGQKRDGSAADPERQAILNRLLTEIDGFEGLSDVMVIGATHRADVLDEALTRSGRLGWNINFTPPDFKSRASLWGFYTKKSPLDESIDFNRITRLSVGMSPADIHEAVNIASLNAAFNQSSFITQQDLEKAIDQIEWGVNDDNKDMLAQELERTAIHEAGHAVMSHLLDMPIERITVRPTQHTLGFVQPMRDEDKVHKTEAESKKEIYMLFAGSIAEKKCLGSRSMGSSSDLDKIRYITQTMFRDEGMGALPEGVDFLSSSPQTKRLVELQEQEYVKKCYEDTVKFISENKDMVMALSKKLIKDREMNADEVNNFFSDYKNKNKLKNKKSFK